METISRLLLGILVAVFIVSAGGCGKSEEKPATTAEKIGDAVQSAGEQAGQAMEKAGEAIKEAAKEGAEKIKEETK